MDQAALIQWSEYDADCKTQRIVSQQSLNTLEVSQGLSKAPDLATPEAKRPPNSVPFIRSPESISNTQKISRKEFDDKKNKLGYQRIRIACSNCRRRKIRCIVGETDVHQRCQDCIRSHRECLYDPIRRRPSRKAQDRELIIAERDSSLSAVHETDSNLLWSKEPSSTPELTFDFSEMPKQTEQDCSELLPKISQTTLTEAERKAPTVAKIECFLHPLHDSSPLQRWLSSRNDDPNYYMFRRDDPSKGFQDGENALSQPLARQFYDQDPQVKTASSIGSNYSDSNGEELNVASFGVGLQSTESKFYGFHGSIDHKEKDYERLEAFRYRKSRVSGDTTNPRLPFNTFTKNSRSLSVRSEPLLETSVAALHRDQATRDVQQELSRIDTGQPQTRANQQNSFAINALSQQRSHKEESWDSDDDGGAGRKRPRSIKGRDKEKEFEFPCVNAQGDPKRFRCRRWATIHLLIRHMNHKHSWYACRRCFETSFHNQQELNEHGTRGCGRMCLNRNCDNYDRSPTECLQNCSCSPTPWEIWVKLFRLRYPSIEVPEYATAAAKRERQRCRHKCIPKLTRSTTAPLPTFMKQRQQDHGATNKDDILGPDYSDADFTGGQPSNNDFDQEVRDPSHAIGAPLPLDQHSTNQSPFSHLVQDASDTWPYLESIQEVSVMASSSKMPASQLSIRPVSSPPTSISCYAEIQDQTATNAAYLEVCSEHPSLQNIPESTTKRIIESLERLDQRVGKLEQEVAKQGQGLKKCEEKLDFLIFDSTKVDSWDDLLVNEEMK